MASKDVKPSRRLGKSNPRRTKIITWTVGLLTCFSGLYAAYHYGTRTLIEVATARVRRADFLVLARSRGDIKSTHSFVVRAPQVPGLRITSILATGTPVHKGDVVVEFDAANFEQQIISQTVQLSSIQKSVEQLQATQAMSQGADTMSKMQSEFDVERSKLDASKAAVLSRIEGDKYKLKVGVQEGGLQQVKASITAHNVGDEADVLRMDQRRIKAEKDLETIKSYLQNMQLRAPADGVVNILSNFRSRGNYGRAQPPFKAGDDAWGGAEIVEIPDLSQLYIDLKLEEVERGKVVLGQKVRVEVDAIPGQEFEATIDFLSPIAGLVYTGSTTPTKVFQARATLVNADNRLRPGMSASADIIVERVENQLLIPARATFDHEGNPAVYIQKGDQFAIRHVKIGKRNDDDVIIAEGIKEGDIVTLESPAEAARRARKKG